MALFTGHTITPDSALGGIQIENSLRFEEDDTTYLSAAPTFNTKKYTFSFWIKPVKKGGGAILSYNMVGNNRQSFSYGDYEGHFANQLRVGGSTKSQYATPAAHRDFSSWYHVVYRWDTDNGTQDDRFIVYVNGVRRAMTQYTGTVSGQTGYIGNGNTINIGKSTDGYSKARFYLADYHLIDGQAYDASYFGYTDAQTGQWRPKIYTGSYGSGGFHLEFKDSSNLGKDTSGNANNWTANNFSVSAGAGKDLVTDTPTNNFPTLNPLDSEGNLPTQGNLQGGTAGTSGWRHTRSTVPLPSSGKWYWECKVPDASANASNGWITGLAYSNFGLTQDINSDSTGLYGRQTDSKYNNSSGSPVTNSHFTSPSNNDILQFAYDADSQTLFTGRNNTWELSANPSTGANPNWTGVASGGFPMVGSYGSSRYVIINFGQQPFSYTPPTGYRSLSGHNRATPDAASVVRPQRFFDTLLWTGDDSSDRNIEGLEFQPDMVWIKNRSQTDFHVLQDSVRGANKLFFPNDTDVEQTDSANGHVNYFTSGGFNVTAGSAGFVNENSENYVAWCWKAGGAAVTNTVGNISAQVSANDEAGFSIITYTGDGNTSGNVGTGLRSTQPLDMAIVKRRDSSSDWQVGHRASGQSSNFAYHMNLNDNTALDGSTPYHMGTQSYTNGDRLYLATGGLTSSATYVAYVWQERPGYSKFGSYIGNGNANGTYVHLGFRPAFILHKDANSTEQWQIKDTARDTSNPVDVYLHPNLSNAENTSTNVSVDFLSNGFKIRNSDGSHNTSGNTYIYMAFAERPSGTMFGLDANAR